MTAMVGMGKLASLLKTLFPCSETDIPFSKSVMVIISFISAPAINIPFFADTIIKQDYIHVTPTVTPNPSRGFFKITFGSALPGLEKMGHSHNGQIEYDHFAFSG